MVIYLDLVLVLNFLVDLMLLLGTNRLCGFPVGLGRSAGAAVLGAVYGAGTLFRGFSFLGDPLWRMVFLGIMGAAAFGWNRSGLRRTGIFVLLSMAMGGISMGVAGKGIPALLLSAGCVWILSRVGFGGTAGGREYIPITITENDRWASVIALKDTGNTLRDPVTGEQALILGPEAAEKLLDLTEDALRHPLETIQTHGGLRLIPYSAVGQPGGFLVGKRFAQVKVGDRVCSALIAFAPDRIGRGQVYQALAGGNF